MALLVTRPVKESLLDLEGAETGFTHNHIFEPEYHQEVYVSACTQVASMPGAYQMGHAPTLTFGPARGTQPSYADVEDDPSSLEFEGMITDSGQQLDADKGMRNVCALKSNCVRRGFIDFNLARSVTRDFHEKKASASILPNDVLVNSTGDGTIGRVAVYNAPFPAIADGHISIIRFSDPIDAWYVAAFLLSDLGQRQIYRYINGSSGQVEIYPQDLARLWIKPPGSTAQKKKIAEALKGAADIHWDFHKKLIAALNIV